MLRRRPPCCRAHELRRGSRRRARPRDNFENMPGRVRPRKPELGSEVSPRRRVLQGRQPRISRLRVRLSRWPARRLPARDHFNNHNVDNVDNDRSAAEHEHGDDICTTRGQAFDNRPEANRTKAAGPTYGSAGRCSRSRCPRHNQRGVSVPTRARLGGTVERRQMVGRRPL